MRSTWAYYTKHAVCPPEDIYMEQNKTIHPLRRFLSTRDVIRTAPDAMPGGSSILLSWPSLVHIILPLLLVELALLFCGRILVLLVLGDQVVHVTLGLRELHLVHALTGVPVEEGLAAEHSRKVLGHA